VYVRHQMDGARAVKRHNAQYDIFNRLHSIASDQTFVEKVAKEWFQGRFEIVRKAVHWIEEWRGIDEQQTNDVGLGTVLRVYV
jgi:hypothetical protein